MSDENNTDTPYQPPTLLDEPLVKQKVDGAQAKLNPANWWVPCLGYGYVPLEIGLQLISEDYAEILFPFSNVNISLLLLTFYGLVILGLRGQRIQQGTNSVGLTLFQTLSIVPPMLWGLLFLYLSAIAL